MPDAPTEEQISKVIAALDAGQVVALNEHEDNPGWHTYDHSYTLRAVGDGGFRLRHRETINDAASVPVERVHNFDRDGLRRWLGKLSAEALAAACVALPAGKFKLLTETLLPSE